jgi:hypothetical protein
MRLERWEQRDNQVFVVVTFGPGSPIERKAYLLTLRDGKIVRVQDQLLVSDVERAAEYYRDRLGFTCEIYGDPSDFIVAERDEAIILMALCDDPERIVPNWRIVDQGRRRRGDLRGGPASRRADRPHALRRAERIPRVRRAGPRRSRQRHRSPDRARFRGRSVTGPPAPAIPADDPLADAGRFAAREADAPPCYWRGASGRA